MGHEEDTMMQLQEKVIEELQTELKAKDVVLKTQKLARTAADLEAKITIKIVDEISELLGVKTEQWMGKPQKAIRKLQAELKEYKDSIGNASSVKLVDRRIKEIEQLEAENEELKKQKPCRKQHWQGCVSRETYEGHKKELQEELKKYRWIPVSEGPPKDSEPVQVVEFMKIKEGYYNGGQYLVWVGNAWCYSNNVTHYRPIILPEQSLKSEVEK